MREEKIRLLITMVLLSAAVFLLLLAVPGCSSTRQQLVTQTEIPALNATITETATLHRWSFFYWTKFQADTKTGEMTARVYNAEGKPDTESIEAVVDSKLVEFLHDLAKKSMFQFARGDE
jgi:hypothetical protein